MKTVRALVVTGFGINCEEESAAAYRLAGGEARIAHLNDVFLEKVSLHEFDILHFPGGFSFGDDLGSGKVLANKMRFKRLKGGDLFFDHLERFLADGHYILGICNGFQALVKMGLLPNIAGKFEQEVTLTRNNSAKFEDRWVRCSANPNVTPFLTGIERIDLPVRHGEGKLVMRDSAIEKAVVEKGLNCLTYVDGQGNPTGDYPANPNGSALHCAGLTDPTGHVFGLMPHPEAFLSLYNHPEWPTKKRHDPQLGDDGEGLAIFRNIVNHIARTSR